MTFKEVLGKVTDESVSDDEVFECLKGFLADRYDDKGEVIPPTLAELGEISALAGITESLRPEVVDRIEEFVVEQFQHHCQEDSN